MPNAEPSVSNSYITRGTYNSYRLLIYPGGVYAYGQDINYILTYFQDKLYTDLAEYNNNTKYSMGKVYAMNTYYGNSGYYIPLEVRCLISPA